MRGVFVFLVLLLLLAAGCRSFLQHRLPQQAAIPAAHHIRVGQLVFHSNFKLPEDDPLVRQLVDERDDVCRTLNLPPSDELINVYLFEDAESYGKCLARYFPSIPPRRAFFVKTATGLSVYAHWSDRRGEDLRHEVAHGYLHSIVPNLPLWLDEGLAEFFEVPRSQYGFNRPHLELLSDMADHDGWQPDLGRLERLVDSAQMDQRHYAESWAWVYFLLHSDPQRRQLLTQYLADLQAEAGAEPLSRRLASGQLEPAMALGSYLAGLNRGVLVR
jgi:hypothetical protein